MKGGRKEKRKRRREGEDNTRVKTEFLEEGTEVMKKSIKEKELRM